MMSGYQIQFETLNAVPLGDGEFFEIYYPPGTYSAIVNAVTYISTSEEKYAPNDAYTFGSLSMKSFSNLALLTFLLNFYSQKYYDMQIHCTQEQFTKFRNQTNIQFFKFINTLNTVDEDIEKAYERWFDRIRYQLTIIDTSAKLWHKGKLFEFIF